MEVERARLTMELARMRESEGDVVEAAKVLQELQVNCLWPALQCPCIRTCTFESVFDYIIVLSVCVCGWVWVSVF